MDVLDLIIGFVFIYWDKKVLGGLPRLIIQSWLKLMVEARTQKYLGRSKNTEGSLTIE